MEGDWLHDGEVSSTREEKEVGSLRVFSFQWVETEYLYRMGWVLFFDGDCGFCNKAVQRVYALDKQSVVDFAPLQGKLAQEKGLGNFADKSGGSMVMLREADDAKFLKGDAWVELGKLLGGIWALLASIFALFPKIVRDWAYDLVAKNRYRFAGKNNACGLPDQELRNRIRE